MKDDGARRGSIAFGGAYFDNPGCSDCIAEAFWKTLYSIINIACHSESGEGDGVSILFDSGLGVQQLRISLAITSTAKWCSHVNADMVSRLL
jgi:hypothetical protein